VAQKTNDLGLNLSPGLICVTSFVSIPGLIVLVKLLFIWHYGIDLGEKSFIGKVLQLNCPRGAFGVAETVPLQRSELTMAFMPFAVFRISMEP